MHRISRAIGALELAFKAKSPTLLVIGGVTAMATAALVACKKTLDVEAVMDPHIKSLELIELRSEQNAGGLVDYSNESQSKDRLVVYARIAVVGIRHYAIPIVLFAGGAGMTFYGHKIMIRRNATLAVAFTAIQRSFEAYRARVLETHGHQADQYFLNGGVDTEFYDDVSGKTERAITRNWEESNKDPYDRVFSQESSSQWKNDLGANTFFIACQQRIAQENLNRKGYLYLHEVYQALGMVESDISRVVGWKIRILPDGSRDIPIVDFGINTPLPTDWKYNKEKSVYLGFNVQGLIIGGKVQQMLERA